MVYKATQDVVRRVMPLLDQLAGRTIDKARLLQYLSARAGEAWGVLDLIEDEDIEDQEREDGQPGRLLRFRDRLSGVEHAVLYPSCLPADIDLLAREEYQRLASDRTLSLMARPLFDYLYAASHCQRCRWRGDAYAQFHRECLFAGSPVNFEPDGSTASG